MYRFHTVSLACYVNIIRRFFNSHSIKLTFTGCLYIVQIYYRNLNLSRTNVVFEISAPNIDCTAGMLDRLSSSKLCLSGAHIYTSGEPNLSDVVDYAHHRVLLDSESTNMFCQILCFRVCEVPFSINVLTFKARLFIKLYIEQLSQFI